VPVGPGYGTIPDAGRLRVEGSVIEAHEVRATGTPDAESGVIRMAASGASLELIENVRVSAADAVHITVHGYPGGEATLRLVDNQDIAAGRFEPELWVPDGVGVFVMTSGSGANVIEVTGNLIRSHGVVELHTRKAPADVTITGNRIEATGDDDGTIDRSEECRVGKERGTREDASGIKNNDREEVESGEKLVTEERM